MTRVKIEEMSELQAIRCLQDLGALGVVVSITYGPSGTGRVGYSVDAMSASGSTFKRPYMAETFVHAVWIAANESLKRNWI